MKKSILFFLIVFWYIEAISQDISEKSWVYQSIAIISDDLADTTVMYSKPLNIKKVKIGDNNKTVFHADSTYITTLNNTVNIDGKWKMQSTNLVFDKDTLSIIKNTSQSLGLKGKYVYLDITATFRNGFILIYYSSTIENIVSVKSGNWNDGSTWSSGRVPNRSDNVTIKQSHKVKLPLTEYGYCRNLLVESGAIFDCKTDKSLIVDPKSD